MALLVAAGLGLFFYIGDAQAGEVFLVPAASAGPDPFSDTPFAEAPDPTVALPASASSPPTPASPNASPVQATSGAKPGLYGGTMNRSACDPGQMVSFLGANPDKAQAWVNALTADPQVRLRDGRPLTTATIPDYVAGLTSFVLLADTRVTNHGFKNGRQTVLQAVLQKGSAVMVDEYGVPRVKCYCGNPLLPPVPSRSRVTYSGPRWPDFHPPGVTVITPPPDPIEEFTACDPRDPSQCFSVPPGGVPNEPIRPEIPEEGEVPPRSMVSENPPQAFPPQPEYPDEEEEYLCSEPNGSPMNLEITNSTSVPLDIVFLDEDCNDSTYRTLQPGESYTQETFAGHWWNAIDRRANNTASTRRASPSATRWNIR